MWRRSLPSGASSHQGWTLPSPLLGLQPLRVIAITFVLQKVSTKVFHQQFSTKKFSTHLSFAHCSFSSWTFAKIQIGSKYFLKKPLPHINKCFSCFCTQSSFISQSSTQLFKLLWGPSRRRGWDRNIFAFQIYFVSALKNAFSWRNVFSGKNERPSVFCRSCYSSLHGHRSRFFLIQLSDVFNPTVGKV